MANILQMTFLKCILLNENVWIWTDISQKFNSKGPINDILALVQIMAWYWISNKPLSEPLDDLVCYIGIEAAVWRPAQLVLCWIAAPTTTAQTV